MTVKIFAPAKINLALHVTGQDARGYHLLDSLVVFVDHGDQIVASRAEHSALSVSGPFAEGVPTDGSNLVLRAAEVAQVPMELELVKNLPPASGIGGGSADAAATLRAARRLGGKEAPADLVLALGADVPVCVASRPMRMRGIGEYLDRVSIPPLHMVLVNPRVEVSTPAVFKALACKQNDPLPKTLPTFGESAAFAAWLDEQRNDLQAPACEIAPDIGEVLKVLGSQRQSQVARMSGSGATCFALFPDRSAADYAANRIANARPEWWVHAVSTLP